MKLHDYLTKTGTKDGAFAAMIPVSRGYITMLKLGIRQRPSLSVALKIEQLTDGKVPVKTWGIA